MSKAYSSNLSQAQFELIEPLIPPAKPGGRHREVEMWAVLNALFYVVVQGCKWRDLPGDLPVWQTVYTYFRNWRSCRHLGEDPRPSARLGESQSIVIDKRVHRKLSLTVKV